MLWPVKILSSEESEIPEIYFLMTLVNGIPKVTLNLQSTITCVSNEIMSFQWKVANIEI